MARVPRNKGSYTQRKGGAFQVKYPLGWSDEKKKYDEYHEEVASEAEAIALIKDINDYVYHGGSPADVPLWRGAKQSEPVVESVTVSEYAEEFIEGRRKRFEVEERTRQSDEECFRRIEPYIGRKPLAMVTFRDIEKAYECMRSEGSDNLGGRAYSGTTMQKTHMFLSMLFNRAVKQELIEKNPCAAVEKPKRDTVERKPLKLEEARSLFEAIAESDPLDPRAVGVLICLSCGLRLSEMLALKWSDYESGAITVERSLERERQSFKSTKTGEERTVPCPLPLIALLKRWREQQRAWYEKQGLRWSDDAPIVNSSNGKHTLQRSFGKWFKEARAGYPIPDDFTLHGLRHTYVTFLRRDLSVDSKTSQSLSGHKTAQVHDGYTHTDEEWRRDAARRLGALLVPERDAAYCLNCRLWSPSPVDATKGVCWGMGEGVSVTDAADPCCTGRFTVLRADDGTGVVPQHASSSS